mmetsp:Transcript_5047/g.8277  ORF Transcript_5047/g.8277 Transcript_5047/m.8277 type:complete len:1079 (-) Transcript_5047:259-3495(-)
MYGRTKKSDVEFAEHQVMKKNRVSALNPLRSFPSTSDTFTKAFFGSQTANLQRKVESKEKWLDPARIEPNFGIKGRDEEDLLRRSYRRVGTTQLFMPLQREGAHLKELYTQKKGSKVKYVLVEEERLSEITRFENILREEQEKIGEQCALVVPDINISVRIPIPATRLAMRNLCEVQMRKSAADMTKLLATWTDYVRKKGYAKSNLYADMESYLRTTPLAERAGRLRDMKHANNKFLQEKFRDTMQFEDDLSAVNEKYINAQLRRQDYDRYFVLATRYGVYSEEEFFRDAHPGDRYYRATRKAAVMFQKLWDCYWPVKRMRMHRAARLYQTCFRRWYAFRKWHPVIVLRMKFGFRSLLRHMIQRWREYISLVRLCTDIFRWYRSNIVPECFAEWKRVVQETVFHRKDLLNRWGKRLQNNACAGVFLQWILFVQKRKKTILFARRILHNPHFLIWVQYTKFSKHVKFLSKHAAVIQAAVRRFIRRWFFLRVKRAVVRLEDFAEGLLAIREKRRRRAIVVDEGFKEWLPTEQESQEKRSNDLEKRRLVVQQQIMQEKEGHLVLDLKRHFKTRSGAIQLKELATKLRKNGIVDENGDVVGKLSKKESVELARKELLRQCTEISRLMGKHDFNTKSPPNFRCADNNCKALFATLTQYQNHMKNCELHTGPDSLQFCDFHNSMKNSKFHECFRQFLINRNGIDPTVNCLDMYLAIQDWRKISISTEAFVHKAVYIYDTFLREGCSRPVPMDFSGHLQIQKEFEKLEFVKYRDFEGFYSLVHRTPGMFRKLFGMKGSQYEAWTTQNIVFSNAFDDVEWEAFKFLFNNMSNCQFYEADEGKAHTANTIEFEKQKIATLKQLFIDARYREIVLWTKAFIVHENRIMSLALHAANTVMALQCNRIIDEVLYEGSYAKTFLIRHDQQKVHEGTSLMAEDVSYGSMEDIVENLYEAYAKAVVLGMWEDPEGRKNMLEFAGYLKPKPKSRLLISMDAKNEGHEWFKKFMDDTIEEEQATIPLNTASAAQRIQRRVRGIFGRNKMRKLFVQIYSKAYDQNSQAFYYINNVTGDTTWERPSFMTRLFPETNW